MELTYTLENNDYLQFNRFVINRVPSLRWQALLRFSFLPGLVALGNYFMGLPWLESLIVLLVVTVNWILYLLWAQRQAIIAQAQVRLGAIDLHTVSLQPDGFYTASTARPPSWTCGSNGRTSQKSQRTRR